MLCVLRLQKGGADGRHAVQCHVLNIAHAVVGGDLQPVQGQTVALLGAVKHLIVLLADLYLRAGTGLPQSIPQRGQRLRRKARHQQQPTVQLCRGDAAAPPERAAAGHQQGRSVPGERGAGKPGRAAAQVHHQPGVQRAVLQLCTYGVVGEQCGFQRDARVLLPELLQHIPQHGQVAGHQRHTDAQPQGGGPDILIRLRAHPVKLLHHRRGLCPEALALFGQGKVIAHIDEQRAAELIFQRGKAFLPLWNIARRKRRERNLIMEKISRKGFLKIAAAAAMSSVTAAGLAACNAASSSTAAASSGAAGIYTPGTYTATAKGMSEITATVTFDANTITKVELDLSGETENIGQAAKDKLIEQVMNAQTSQIDGVTGATVTSKAVQNAVADCIRQASGGAINPAEQTTEETASTADWLGEEPEVAESDIKQTVECEVLVVGAGSSGSFAAAAAAEAGAKTILIEKFGHDMASGIRDTLAACGSKQQQEDGDDVNKKDAVRYLCNWSQGYTRRSLAQVWADRSGETIDWFTDVLAESGIDFRHEIDEKHDNDNYEVLDVGHSTQYDEYNEKLTMDAVLKHAEADGLEVQYEITMVKLEKDGNRVTGLIAKNANDEYVRYNASKGVILACGGYSGNETMMNALQPQSVEQTCVNYSKSGAKGDGIKACLWAGAIMDTTHTSMIFDRGAIKPDQVGEYGKANDGARFWMGSQPFLKVNLNGERFMNEYMPYDLVLHAAASQPYHTYCTVWDSKYPEDVKRFATHGCSRLYPHVNGTAPVFPMEYIEGMNADLQDQGYIVQADTVEELADKLGLPKDTFTATVDRYNELAAKGEDEDYGKEDYRLSTLSEAPFYGVRQSGGYLLCTMDGIQIDDNMHALDHDFKAIPGLYVIGDMSGNYFSGSYPCLMAGAAAGRSATFGRFAGQNAAAGI